MDVPDEGFRHVGRCERLEELWLMFTREGMAVFPSAVRRSSELLVIAGDCGVVAPKIDVAGYSYVTLR